eukprot:1161908-Pelagomonas_calceolata.AAC.1
MRQGDCQSDCKCVEVLVVEQWGMGHCHSRRFLNEKRISSHQRYSLGAGTAQGCNVLWRLVTTMPPLKAIIKAAGNFSILRKDQAAVR